MKGWVGTDRNVVLHDRRHRGSPPTFPNRLNGRKGLTPAHNRKHGDNPMDFLHFIGIDVSKNWFDVAVDASARKARRFDNTAEGIALFCTAFADHLKDGFVVLEATGGYETALIAALVTERVALHRAAPWQACSFSRSLGKQAKTDGLDAKALARFAAERHTRLRRFELPSQDQQCLNELMMRRVDLVAFQMAEKTRADHPRYARATPAVRQSLADSRAFLASQIKAVEAQIEALIAASPELRARSDVMTSQIGVGERTARILQAFLPELGGLTRRAAASLAGCAPHARDSGAASKYRSVFGGRSAIKRVLFTAALSARTHDPNMRNFFDKLTKAGKPKMVAIVAIMRKIIVRLNAKLRPDLITHHGR
jgi:transposase